jgi:ATP-binding cassette subfamily B protein/subfamily B ATP-binding cassette protein MsbA
VLRRVGRYLRPYRGRFLLQLLLVAALSAGEIAKPWPLKIVVDHVLGDRPLEPARRLGLDAHALLVAVCAGALALHIALAVLRLLLNRGTIEIGQRMVADLRAELVAHLHRLSLGFFGRRRSGDLVYRVAYDTLAIQGMTMNGFFPLASSGLLLTGIAVVLFRMNATLASIFLGVAPALLLAIRLLGRRVSELARETRESESRLLSEAERGIGAIAVVQAFTAEPREHERVMRASSDALSSTLRLNLFETGYAGVINVVMALGTVAVLYAGATLGLAGRLSVGELLVFVSYLASLYAPLSALSQIVARLESGAAGARRVFEVLDEEPGIRDTPHGRTLHEVRGEVRFEDVHFRYPEGRFGLCEISFTADPGMRVALVGPTGAGKSTLASLIPRFHDPTRGRILLDGRPLPDILLHSLRAQIGLVPQSPLLFPATLAENIRYGHPTASDDDVRTAAAIAGVSSFAEALPLGFATPVGPQGQALSQGQMQRVAIARALVRDPRILILDEPTSALDPETEAYVIDALERAGKGRTTFIIAHRLSTVRRAHRLIVLDAGRMVQDGTYESLRTADGLFRRLVDAHRLFDAQDEGKELPS